MTTEHSKPVESEKVWAIDHSAGRPILVLNGCSVIEAEDAEYVLSLIRKAADDKAGGDAPFLFVYFDPTAGTHGAHKVAETHPPPADAFPVYTRPQPQAAQPAERVALTDDQVDSIVSQYIDEIGLPEGNAVRKLNAYRALVRAGHEAAHGITAKDQA